MRAVKATIWLNEEDHDTVENLPGIIEIDWLDMEEV